MRTMPLMKAVVQSMVLAVSALEVISIVEADLAEVAITPAGRTSAVEAVDQPRPRMVCRTALRAAGLRPMELVEERASVAPAVSARM